MKKLGDILLNPDPFEDILMGNHALVRAMMETHTRVVTSYPGSPTPEIASAIDAVTEAVTDSRGEAGLPFYFEFSVNEKVAAEVAFGAALNGNLSCVFFKSVGLNVVLDTFVQLPLMEIIGGMVVILGDDPGANSSQNEQDNRNIYRMSRVTVLEPGSPKEAYQYYKYAAEFARQANTVVVLRLTTHVCHARQKIKFGALTPPLPYHTDFDSKNGPYIALTAMALEMKQRSIQKLDLARQFTIDNKLNTRIGSDTSRNKGIITSGLTSASVMDVLESAKFRPAILKLGVVHPLEPQSILSFLNDHDQVLVLEELDTILEFEIKALAYDAGLSCKIIGKTQTRDFIGEYTPDKTYAKLAQTWADILPQLPEEAWNGFQVPHRPAQMCPGCGHRSAFFAIKQALKDEDVTVADIGCHTLGYMPPYNLGQILVCMGASSGMASGLSLNNKKRVVAFLGDSTFFHAGMTGLVNTVFNDHDITLILMENNTTAMTGHQDHAGEKISIQSVLQGIGIEHIFSCDTYNQKKLAGLVKEAMGVKGISVVIASHPCMLKFTRQQRQKQGYIQQHVNIDQQICSRSYACVEDFGCPTFIRKADGSIDINLDLCIGDGSCRASCPQNAIGFDKGEK